MRDWMLSSLGSPRRPTVKVPLMGGMMLTVIQIVMVILIPEGLRFFCWLAVVAVAVPFWRVVAVALAIFVQRAGITTMTLILIGILIRIVCTTSSDRQFWPIIVCGGGNRNRRGNSSSSSSSMTDLGIHLLHIFLTIHDFPLRIELQRFVKRWMVMGKMALGETVNSSGTRRRGRDGKADGSGVGGVNRDSNDTNSNANDTNSNDTNGNSNSHIVHSNSSIIDSNSNTLHNNSVAKSYLPNSTSASSYPQNNCYYGGTTTDLNPDFSSFSAEIGAMDIDEDGSRDHGNREGDRENTQSRPDSREDRGKVEGDGGKLVRGKLGGCAAGKKDAHQDEHEEHDEEEQDEEQQKIQKKTKEKKKRETNSTCAEKEIKLSGSQIETQPQRKLTALFAKEWASSGVAKGVGALPSVLREIPEIPARESDLQSLQSVLDLAFPLLSSRGRPLLVDVVVRMLAACGRAYGEQNG